MAGEPAYDVSFGPDVEAMVAAGGYEVLESISRRVDDGQPPRCTSPRHVRFDAEGVTLALGPSTTADGRYSAVEVSTTPCVDQVVLDRMLATGSMQCMVPGREAVFRDVVCSPHFVDGRADAETVNAGVVVQSWRGHLAPGQRQRLVAMALSYIGGPGLFPAFASRSRHRRYFSALVADFNTGFMWRRIFTDFDPTTPHDVAIRWHPDRSVDFVVDHRTVVSCPSERLQVSPLKLSPEFGRGIDLVGHRHLTAEPCSLTAFTDCVAVTPQYTEGRRFSDELWLRLSGFSIRPIPGLV